MPQYNGRSSNVESHDVTNDDRPLTVADVRALRELLGADVVDPSAEMPSSWQESSTDNPWVDEERADLDSALLGSDLEYRGLPTFVTALPPLGLHSLSGARSLFVMAHHHQALRDLPPVFELQSGGRQRESRLAIEQVELGLLATGILGVGVAHGSTTREEDRLALTLESNEVPLASVDVIPGMVSASDTDGEDAAPSTRQTTTALGLDGMIVTNQFESPVGAVLQGLPSDEKAQVARPHEQGTAGPNSPSEVADQAPSAAADTPEMPPAEPTHPAAEDEASLGASPVEGPAAAATLIEPPVDVAVPIDPTGTEPPAEDVEPGETPAVTPAPVNPPPDDSASPDPIPLPSKPTLPPADPPTEPKPLDLPSPALPRSVGPPTSEPAAVPTTASTEFLIPPEQHAAESSFGPSSVEEPSAGYYGWAEEGGVDEAWVELLQIGASQPTVDVESVVQTNDLEGSPWSAESALRNLLINPVDYAPPAEPIVEYSAPGLGVDAATAEALMTLLGASVHADLAELSAAFAERDEHEGPRLEALPKDVAADVPLLEELPYDAAADDQQDLSHHDLPELTLPNEIIDH